MEHLRTILVLSVGLHFIAACGSSSTPGGASSAGGNGGQVVGGGGGNSVPGTGGAGTAGNTGSTGAGGNGGTNLSMFDNFVSTANQTSLQLTLDADGTYQFIILTRTSTVTADEILEKGRFVLSGGTISFTPTEHSCATPLTPSTDGYAENGAGLALITSSGVTVLVRAPVLDTSALTLVVGCGSPFAPVALTGSDPVPSNPGSSPSLYGSWLVTAANGLQVEVTLNQDMTYGLQLLVPTSTTTGNRYVETGTFSFQGATLILTPTQASCPVVTPIKSYSFGYSDANLGLTDSSGTTTNYPRTTTTQLGANLTTVVVGCSINNGPWMPEPIAPVKNN